jgi:hypothetical protein
MATTQQQSSEPRQDDDKTLKRENELTELSRMNPADLKAFESSKLERLGEKVKEGLHNVGAQISQTISHLKEKFQGEQETSSSQISNLQSLNTDEIGAITSGEYFFGSVAQPVYDDIPKFEEASVSFLKRGLNMATEAISHGVDTVKGLVSSKPQQSTEEPKEQSNEWEKPLGQARPKTQPVEPAGPSLAERVREGIHDVASQISHSVESVKNRFTSSHETGEGKSLPAEKAQDVKEKGEAAPEGFHKVTTGFNETVAEYKHEQRIDVLGQELTSNNPFEPLGKDTAENQEAQQGKSWGQQIKEGLVNVATNISGKIAETKSTKSKAPPSGQVQGQENLPQTA